MVSGWTGLLTFLLVSELDGSDAAEDISKDGGDGKLKEETNRANIEQPWLGSLLGLTRRDLRADKDDMFWATRGKRSTEDDFWAIRGKRDYIKLKPNGLFGTIKRSSLKPNSLFTAFKRGGFKPNGLFGTYKRSGLKPNGLFGSIKLDRKRPSLKPNGLFGAYKRSGLKPNGLFGAYKRPAFKPNGLFGAYKRASFKPNGLFGTYKRSVGPNDYFEIEDHHEDILDDEDSEQEYFNYVEADDYDEDNEIEAEKREDAEFWAARGKKEDMDFWATRG